jgi:hypothetical protein
MLIFELHLVKATLPGGGGGPPPLQCSLTQIKNMDMNIDAPPAAHMLWVHSKS